MKLNVLYLFVAAASAAYATDSESEAADRRPRLRNRNHHGVSLGAPFPTPCISSNTQQQSVRILVPGENNDISQQTHRNRKLEEYVWVGRNPSVKLTRCQGEYKIN